LNTESVTQMRTIDLAFDRHNPRLVEFEITNKTTDEEMIQLLWNVMDVHELVLSIAASGFFPYEALLVAKEAGKNIVIEGNRRLAAVRILLEPGIVDSGYVTIPKLAVEVRDSLRELPVLVGTRQDSWRHLGFKHVNGPAKWGSYAKSRYIADVHRKYDVPLDDIAQQIGDTHDDLGGPHVHSHHQRGVRNQRVGRGRAPDPTLRYFGRDEAHHAGALEVRHQGGHGRLRQTGPAGQRGA